MIKILTILGARPQFIKAAVVSRAIKQYNRRGENDEIKEIIIHTGQHFDRNMSDVFFEEMDIPRPSRYLNINQMSHGAMTGRMLEAIEKILIDERPDLTMVYGDTNSTLAGALAAVKLYIPIAHVEAGLRSHNRIMPEEHNRVLTDHLSMLLFCPTRQSVDNLIREGISDYVSIPQETIGKSIPQIFQVGDVMYDAALYYAEKAGIQAQFAKSIIDEQLRGQRFVLVTVHREENTENEDRFLSILGALNEISREIPLVWPVHPRIKARFEGKTIKDKIDGSRIIRIDPVGYFDMIELIKKCCLVLTDSGGLQKEAFFFSKPCVTLRDETEWVELSDNGYNRIAGSQKDRIVQHAHFMLDADLDFEKELYGKGDSGNKIVSIISKTLSIE